MKIPYLIVLTIVCGILIFLLYGRESKNDPHTDLEKLVGQIEFMSKVNDKPSLISPRVFMYCRLPTPAERTKGQGSPHENYYINVYVNDIGKKTMLETKIPNYPVGSVIIKEKFPFSMEIDSTDDIKKVDLYTIMIKREEGYNSECGDWEFGAINGDFSDSEAGKISKCISCHRKNPEMDFVFRDEYLGSESREKINQVPE